MYLTKSVIVVILATLLAGCASVSHKPKEQVLTERANKRWLALVSGDLETSYGFHSPAYREVKSLERYMRTVYGVGTWVSGVVTGVACASELACKVKVDVTASVMMRGMREPMDSTTRIEESWIYDEEADNWWFVPRR